MSLIDQADRLLMDNKAPVITEAMQAEQTRQLHAGLDKLGATALRIRDERDALLEALDRLVALITIAAADHIVIESDHAAVLNALAALAMVQS